MVTRVLKPGDNPGAFDEGNEADAVRGPDRRRVKIRPVGAKLCINGVIGGVAVEDADAVPLKWCDLSQVDDCARPSLNSFGQRLRNPISGPDPPTDPRGSEEQERTRKCHPFLEPSHPCILPVSNVVWRNEGRVKVPWVEWLSSSELGPSALYTQDRGHGRIDMRKLPQVFLFFSICAFAGDPSVREAGNRIASKLSDDATSILPGGERVSVSAKDGRVFDWSVEIPAGTDFRVLAKDAGISRDDIRAAFQTWAESIRVGAGGLLTVRPGPWPRAT